MLGLQSLTGNCLGQDPDVSSESTLCSCRLVRAIKWTSMTFVQMMQGTAGELDSCIMGICKGPVVGILSF